MELNICTSTNCHKQIDNITKKYTDVEWYWTIGYDNDSINMVGFPCIGGFAAEGCVAFSDDADLLNVLLHSLKVYGLLAVNSWFCKCHYFFIDYEQGDNS